MANSSNGVVSSILSLFRRPPEPGQDEEHPLELMATPGLMTLLDVALYRSVEGELTNTVSAGHALLRAWLDAKHQAQRVLLSSSSYLHHDGGGCPARVESFARACLEASTDVVEKLSTDPLASSANLSDAHESSGGSAGSSSTSSSVTAVADVVHAVAHSKSDSGRRRRPLPQRPRDCWETARLLCPDHVWADDAFGLCQRHIRHLSKHSFCSNSGGSTVSSTAGHQHEWEREAQTLRLVVQQDLPMRLYQFRTAVEADGVVAKRLYLVKCEYRAPFRAFLEAHQSVYRAPSLDSVDEFCKLQKQPNKLMQKRKQVEADLQALLETPELLEAISLEQECETLEVRMAQALFPFTELARILDHKRARLKVIRNVLDAKDVGPVSELLFRRLKFLLCRKSGPETSSGIRPLLLDLQGVPRDETPPTNKTIKNDLQSMLIRLKELIRHLKILGTLCKSRNAFVTDKRGDADLPADVVKGCRKFDDELFAAQCEDWYNMVQRQHSLAGDFDALSERIRRAEMQVGISRASEGSLGMVRQRLELIANDRERRFEVLKDLVEEVCLREMNLYVKLLSPEKDVTLELPSTGAEGVYGLPLVLAGERLPLG